MHRGSCGRDGGGGGKGGPWEGGQPGLRFFHAEHRTEKQNPAEQPARARACAGRSPGCRAVPRLGPAIRKSGRHPAGKRSSGSQVGPRAPASASESILGNRNCLTGTDFPACHRPSHRDSARSPGALHSGERLRLRSPDTAPRGRPEAGGGPLRRVNGGADSGPGGWTVSSEAPFLESHGLQLSGFTATWSSSLTCQRGF